MKILVTGASGFIGQRFLRSLKNTPHEIFALDSRPLPNPSDFSLKKFYCQDIIQPFQLNESFDIVFHLAACNFTHVGQVQEEIYHRVNVFGTENVIRSAVIKHFVFLSTAKVYAETKESVDECSPLEPTGAYAKSKWKAEEVCQKYFSFDELTIFRSVNIVGPGQEEKAVMPVFLKKALAGEPLELIRSSDTWLQLLYADDVIGAFFSLLKENKGLGIVNLAPEETISLGELARKIVQISRSNSLIKELSRPAQVRNQTKVIAVKAFEQLRWKSTTKIDDMIEECLKTLGPRRPKGKVLICGILPPPNFGHSMMYKILMNSDFLKAYDVTFLNMHFWSYQQHKKVTWTKVGKLFVYLGKYVFLIIKNRPRYVLYNMSFDRMPFVKDFLFCWVGRILGCRIVLHDMGQYIRELYDASGPIMRWLIRRLSRLVTASIVLGENTKEKYHGLMSAERVLAVPGSVEDTENIIVQGEKSTGQIHVLYFSFLSRSKGIWTALNAIPSVIKTNPQVKFLFAGPFENDILKKEIEEFVNQENLKNHVEFFGYIADPIENLQIHRRSDIFIFPTLRDVFGLVLLHAMAERLPIVASREGCIPEIIEGGKNGFLIPKGDHEDLARKIILLANDANLRRNMGEENRRRYLDFYTPVKYGERMIAVFKQIENLDLK